MKKNSNSIVRCALFALAFLVAIMVLHYVGNIERGYSAIGGEVMLFALPIVAFGIAADEKRDETNKRKSQKPNGKRDAVTSRKEV